MENNKNSRYGWGEGNGSGSGINWGSGYGSGSGYGDGYGDGRGYGDGSGYGDGDGTEEARKKIELNILLNIPEIDLPMFIDIWEFQEIQNLFLKMVSEINLTKI